LAPDDCIHLELIWRFAQPIIWQPDRRIRVSLKKRDFSLLDGEEDAFDELY
jgi:hypothetical protein